MFLIGHVKKKNVRCIYDNVVVGMPYSTRKPLFLHQYIDLIHITTMTVLLS